MSPMTPSAMTPSSMTPAAAAPSARRRPGRRRVLGQRLGRPRALEVPTLQVSHGRSSTERRTGSCCAGTSSKGLLGSCRGPTAPSATRRRRCGTRHGSLPTSDLQSLEPSSTSPRQAGRHRRRCDACRRQAMHANTRKSGTEWSAGDRSHFSTAGDRSHFGTAEDRSHFATAGDRSHFATAGDRSHLTTAEDRSNYMHSGRPLTLRHSGRPLTLRHSGRPLTFHIYIYICVSSFVRNVAIPPRKDTPRHTTMELHCRGNFTPLPSCLSILSK